MCHSTGTSWINVVAGTTCVDCFTAFIDKARPHWTSYGRVHVLGVESLVSYGAFRAPRVRGTSPFGMVVAALLGNDPLGDQLRCLSILLWTPMYQAPTFHFGIGPVTFADPPMPTSLSLSTRPLHVPRHCSWISICFCFTRGGRFISGSSRRRVMGAAAGTRGPQEAHKRDRCPCV